MRNALRLLLPLLLVAGTAAAQEPPADALLVQQFIDGAREPCDTKPAQDCVDIGFWFGAAEPERGLTLQDVRLLRQRLGTWYEFYQPGLPPQTRGAFGLGLLLADGMTMERLHAAFDADSDGWVTQAELLADVTLDQRPLGEVLGDPAAVDRAGLATRLGLPPAMVESLFPQ